VVSKLTTMRFSPILSLLIMFVLSTHAQDSLTIEKIWKDLAYAPDTYEDIVFLNNNASFVRVKGNSIVQYNALTGDSISAIYNAKGHKILDDRTIHECVVDKSNNYFLLATQAKGLFRNSFKAKYVLFDKQLNAMTTLLPDDSYAEVPSFSPNGEMIAFVQNNNLFIKGANNIVPVTKDGKCGSIINGRGDWAYEEEFYASKAYQWSPDSKWIAWLCFDESKVMSYSIPLCDSINSSVYTYKYPKPGFPVSNVSIKLYNVQNKKTVTVNIPKSTYIPSIHWSPDSKQIAIETLNRLQDTLKIYSYNLATMKTSVLYQEISATFIKIPNYFTWLKDSGRFALITPRNGFFKLCRFDKNGKEDKAISALNNNVNEVLGYNPFLDYIYFSFAEPDEMNKKIYRVMSDGSSLGFISPEEGTNTLLGMANDFSQFVYSNTNALQEYTVYGVDYQKGLKNVIYSNKTIVEQSAKMGLTGKEFFTIPTVGNKELQTWVMKPPQFNKAHKYPVLIYVYGGPQHKTVTNEYDYDYYWQQYLVQKGYIVLSFDPRGTTFEDEIYKQLGTVETEDLEHVLTYIKTQNWVDSTRIGIEGWSFGGYLTLMGMTHTKDFKCGVSIAPVTDWKFYDCVYTERYLQTPLMNKDAYTKASVLESAKNLSGELLLIQGSADDNVLIQNAYELCKVFNNNNIHYNLLIYPDKKHSISGKGIRFHLYSEICRFILKNL